MPLSPAARSLLERLRQVFRSEYRQGCRNSMDIPGLMERWREAVQLLEERQESQRLRDLTRSLEGEAYRKLKPPARRQILTAIGLDIGRLLGDAPSLPAADRPRPAPPGSPGSSGSSGGLFLDTDVTYIKGVGPKLAGLLANLGVQTAADLIGLLPRRWEDRTRVVTAREAEEGETVVLQGRLGTRFMKQPRPGMSLLVCPLQTADGVVDLVWFNQKWLASTLKPNREVSAYGKVERKFHRPQMTAPDLEDLHDPQALAGRWVPVYPTTARMSQRWIRSLMQHVVPQLAPRLPEPLPAEIRRRRSFLNRQDALMEFHFPTHPVGLAEARRRLAYEELFFLQVEIGMQRRTRELEPRQTVYQPDKMQPEEFFSLLPFRPTRAQERVAAEIIADLQTPTPMNRLLQGDVGSGKTAVAAFAAWAAIRQGYQAAIMAPTEILAEQHYQKLTELLAPAGLRLGFLSGSLSKKVKDEVKGRLARHEIDLLVGTHALIQPDVDFARLSLVVVDEQHKFGVLQRTVLRQKGYGNNPDLLVMTATPIPRTLALTVHGELEVSRLDELPPGRQPILSRSVPFSQRKKVYTEITAQIEEGRQAYIICPLIEESEAVEASSAVEEFKVLQEKVFPNYSVGLLHGRMKAAEKEAVMEAFRRGDHHILVSTTVIEVGVDVPNATVMLVQDANRFGLSQLHQLRGRVGRGAHASHCIFMADAKSADGMRRLKAIAQLSDGFEVAEEDLQIRGPGDYFGLRQSGFPEFQVADLTRDLLLLEEAREDARDLLSRDPELESQPALRQHLKLRAERTAELVH